MKTKKKELKNIFKKMMDGENFISIDEVYLNDYSNSKINYLVGKSVISDSKDITSLVKATIKDAGIKANSHLTHALFHIEISKKTPLEQVIRIVADIKGHLKCDFNFAVGTSTSKDIKLFIVAQR